MMVPPQKDIAAFSCLYDKYAPALYGVILKLHQDVVTANGILEKSFIKIWEGRGFSDRSKDSLFLWMLRITLQECNQVQALSVDTIFNLINNRTIRSIKAASVVNL